MPITPPPMWEVDSKGNCQPRPIGDIQADLDAFYGASLVSNNDLLARRIRTSRGSCGQRAKPMLLLNPELRL